MTLNFFLTLFLFHFLIAFKMQDEYFVSQIHVHLLLLRFYQHTKLSFSSFVYSTTLALGILRRRMLAIKCFAHVRPLCKRYTLRSTTHTYTHAGLIWPRLFYYETQQQRNLNARSNPCWVVKEKRVKVEDKWIERIKKIKDI